MIQQTLARVGIQRPSRLRPGMGTFMMALVILVLGFYLITPVVILLTMSFNVATDILVPPWQWGISNWTDSWDHPLLLPSLWNSFIIWFFVVVISLPSAIAISWILARTKIKWTYTLEYLFWVAFMFPSLASTIGWMMILDPDVGFANTFIESLPFVDKGPFNIFSVPGIVWARLMGDGVAYKVMLLTPAFRNMDRTLEEAGRVSGASDLRTMWRVTLPMMSSPIVLVFALQLIRVFQGFETEQLIGTPWGFYVYSTLIYRLVSLEAAPQYAQAVVLGSLTFLIILLIIPLQRWIINRRHYTTVTGSFKPGLVDLGRWHNITFGSILFFLFVLTVLPFVIVIVGSFMARAGFLNTTPLWTMAHWQFVFDDNLFFRALRTTTILAIVAGIGSPMLFSIVAYLIVRTKLRGRGTLDSIIWISAGIPGILSGLGLLIMFLWVPGLSWLYGTIWALILVLIISGNTTGTNIFKGVFVQLGNDLEEASRVAGAGWMRTYFTVVLPVLMPTMVLIGVLNFVSAAGATSNIILLASRKTITLSLLTLEYAAPEIGRREAAGIVTLVIMAMTLGVAMVGRNIALRMGVRHNIQAHGDPVGRVRGGRRSPTAKADAEPATADG